MKISRMVLMGLLSLPLTVMAVTYQGKFSSSTKDCSESYQIVLDNCSQLHDADVAALKDTQGKNYLAFKRSGVACEALAQLPVKANVLQLSNMCVVATNFYPFETKKSYTQVKKLLKNLPAEQKNLLQINADNAGLMVGLAK